MGSLPTPYGYDFSQIDQPGIYGYWDHMDYIVNTAERNGIYIGMVCIWGGLVKGVNAAYGATKLWHEALKDDGWHRISTPHRNPGQRLFISL